LVVSPPRDRPIACSPHVCVAALEAASGLKWNATVAAPASVIAAIKAAVLFESRLMSTIISTRRTGKTH
jgi:hypothetical protein